MNCKLPHKYAIDNSRSFLIDMEVIDENLNILNEEDFDRINDDLEKKNIKYYEVSGKPWLKSLDRSTAVPNVDLLNKVDNKRKELGLFEDQMSVGSTQQNKNQILLNQLFNNQKESNTYDVLDKIDKNHPLQPLIKKLLSFPKLKDVKISLQGKPLGEKNAAYYIPGTNEIIIFRDTSFPKENSAIYYILHESLHAITYDKLRTNTDFVKTFDKIRRRAKSYFGENHSYYTQNNDEFMTGIFTDEAFIKGLQNITPLNKNFNNLWEEILDAILNVLGITKKDNLYNQAVAIASQIIDGDFVGLEVKDYVDNEIIDRISREDKIIFGHPGIGKTFLRETRDDFIDVDNDYKKEHTEQKRLREVAKRTNRDEDFKVWENYVKRWWTKVKQDANKSKKKILVSNLPILRMFPEDFDRVITMSFETFISRAKQRNDYKQGETEDWKNSLDKEISKIPISKIIVTDKYLSEILGAKQESLSDEVYGPEVRYQLRIINALQSDKVRQPKLDNLQGFYNDIKNQGIPSQQIDLVKDILSDTKEGITKEGIIRELLVKYSYTVEIETAKTKRQSYRSVQVGWNEFENQEIIEEVDTNHYSNLTVPGGTNYRENEIRTPDIIPSITGHAQFATKEGIGWFRSDNKTIPDVDFSKLSEKEKEHYDKYYDIIPTKTRRILEVQSDLFQKGRDKKVLISSSSKDVPELYPEELEDIETPFKVERNQNQFLQLLNKDNQWVTFFIRAIIQSTAKERIYEASLPDIEEKVLSLQKEGKLKIDCK